MERGEGKVGVREKGREEEERLDGNAWDGHDSEERVFIKFEKYKGGGRLATVWLYTADIRSDPDLIRNKDSFHNAQVPLSLIVSFLLGSTYPSPIRQ